MSLVSKSRSLIAALGVVVATAAHALDVPAEYAVSVDPQGPVRYLGLVDREDAGLTSQSQQYGANGLGLAFSLALMALHGIAIDHRLTHQLRRLQEISDGIAAPHNEALAGMSSNDLLGELARSAEETSRTWRVTSNGERHVTSTPAFGVSEDATTVVIENKVQITGTGVPSTYSVVVRVVRDHEKPGAPIAEKVAASLAATGASGADASASSALPTDPAYAGRLQEATRQLFIESIDLALRDSMREFASAAEPARTYRFKQGGALNIERGRRIASTCERLILRNLQGGITSLPFSAANKVDSEECPRAGTVR